MLFPLVIVGTTKVKPFYNIYNIHSQFHCFNYILATKHAKDMYNILLKSYN